MTSPSSSSPPTEGGPPPRLSAWSFWIILGGSLALFIGLQPFWRTWDIQSADANILWSYVPIPIGVLVCLVVERKLSGASWVLETIKILLAKFVVTYIIANAVWAIFGPPVPADDGDPEPARSG